MNNLDWIKENANLFLDQNISCSVSEYLKKKGYKKVFTVFSMKYVGANDGKLLNLLRGKKMILVTFDKHFNKMAFKYNKQMSILCFRNKPNDPNYTCNTKTMGNRIEQELIHKSKQIMDYYRGQNG